MRIYAIAKSSVILAFTVGVLTAAGVAIFHYLVSPYLSHPPRPEFQIGKVTNFPMPLAKFVEKPKQFIPSSPDVKYQGTVNAGRGLVLRAEPKPKAARVGGVEYKANVSILKETDDKQWVYIQKQGSKEAGWVRTGNIFRN
jgi:Bacterial SH3 domain